MWHDPERWTAEVWVDVYGFAPRKGEGWRGLNRVSNSGPLGPSTGSSKINLRCSSLVVPVITRQWV